MLLTLNLQGNLTSKSVLLKTGAVRNIGAETCQPKLHMVTAIKICTTNINHIT